MKNLFTTKNLAVFVAVIGLTGNGHAYDAREQIYGTPSLFQQLSSLSQSRLEQLFGKIAEDANASSAENWDVAGGGIQIQAFPENQYVNNPLADADENDTQADVSIARAGTNIVVAFTDSGSDNGVNEHFTGYSISTDGGETFQDMGTLPVDPDGFGDFGLPRLSYDATSKRLYLSTLGHSQSHIQIFRSDDDGFTFMDPVHVTVANSVQDMPFLTVDPFQGSGNGNVYLAFRTIPSSGTDGIRFSRSIDQGSTWSTPALVASEGSGNVNGPFIVVGRDHAVHLFYLDQSAGDSSTNSIKVITSLDQGVSFGSAVTVQSLNTTTTNGDLSLNGGFDTHSFPQAVAHPINPDLLYMVYNDRVLGADFGDIFMTFSSDAGGTWSSPVRINRDAGYNDQYYPSIAITSDGKKMMISWYDRRNDSSNSYIDKYAVLGNVNATSGAVTFGPNFKLNSESFPVVRNKDPLVSSSYMGLYDQTIADNLFFYTTWVDNRGPSQVHSRQPDVEFSKVSVNGIGAVIGYSGSSLSGGNRDGDIDLNECNQLKVTVENQGTSAATGLVGYLSTTTPGVYVTHSKAATTNMNAAFTADLGPFQFSTDEDYNCGDPVDFELTVTTTKDGTFVLPFSVQYDSIFKSQSFSNNVTRTILDEDEIESMMSVSGITEEIARVEVSFYITHGKTADLDIWLEGPDGTTVTLTTDNGGTGDDYGSSCTGAEFRTTFSDSADRSITIGLPPFLGSYRPEGDLADFQGLSGGDVNGTWILRIADDAVGTSGTLHCWSLTVYYAECDDLGKSCFDRPGDWDHNGNTDILWRNPKTGENSVWMMNGTQLASTLSLQPLVGANWEVGGVGDFSGSGESEIAWRNKSTGASEIWLMNQFAYVQSVNLPQIFPLAWRMVGSGDFTGDGSPDLLMRNISTGANGIWEMNGLTPATFISITSENDLKWAISGVADFNQDGDVDILWRNLKTGQIRIWHMDGTSIFNQAMGPKWKQSGLMLCAVGDFNGNGYPDLVWRNKETGLNTLWLMEDNIRKGIVKLPKRTGPWMIVGPK